MQALRFLKSLTRAGLLLASSLAAAAFAAVQAAPAPAGIAITNTATGSYVDSAPGASMRLTSNTVSTVVQALEALTLTANQTITSTAGGAPAAGASAATFSLPHQLTNTGNVTTTYALTVSSLGGSFTAANFSIVVDSNNNGVADPGEPVLGPAGTVTLAPGAVSNLLVVGSAPATASAGQTTQLRLSARSSLQGATASDTDTINIAAGPQVGIVKSASTPSPAPSGALTYTLTAQNSGGSAANPQAVTVNAAPASFVVLRDAIPANTTFTSATSASAGATTLYHHLGDPASTYWTSPSTSTAIDTVAWAVATLPAGASLTGSFTVSVNGNAAGTLSNTGYADFSAQGANTTVASNAVSLPLPPLAPTISFYTSGAYTTPTVLGGLGLPIYVQVNAAQCNTNPTAIVTHPITLVSALTGDTETFTATETAPNTGMFRILPNVPTANAQSRAAVSGDGILEVLPDDRVTASLAGCGAGTVSTNLLIDPSGTVFNSKTNAPVAGATVELIDVSGAGNGGHPGGAATVYATDGVTPAPATVVTGVAGSYSFPDVPPSTYRLVVQPPSGLAFPSKVAPAMLPPGRNVNGSASYGGTFTIAANNAPLMFDIPLDAGAAGGLFLQKTASKAAAAVGDFVDYVVTINNNTGIVMPALVVSDTLPAGFAYVKGSTRLNGEAITNPVGGTGPNLQFGVGALVPGTQGTLTYRVRIGPGAQSGNGTNTAQAASGATRSNAASATVKITGGTLSNQAYLFGKVYADCNANRLQDAGEPGIPGIRIYLDDGTFAETDSEGKYSLYGLTPRLHVAKLDTTTLPSGAQLEVLDNRNAFDPGSQFADIQNGELHKTDFAVRGCSDALRSEIAARRKTLSTKRAEIAVAAATPIAVNPAPVADVRTLAASGVIGQNAQAGGNLSSTANPVIQPANGQVASGAPVSDPAGSGAGMQRAAPAAPRESSDTLDHELRVLTPDLGFVNLIDGGVIPAAQTRVRVKGAFGTQLHLSVNGTIIGMQQVGEQSSLESRGVTVWDYVGVNLQPGENLLTVAMIDTFGNTRGTQSIHLLAPGPLAKILVSAPQQASADVQTPIEVSVELQDERGIPVYSRTPVTLESSLGEWQTPDLDPKEPGTQVFIENGVGHFKLLAPATPGKGVLRVTSGALKTEVPMTFLPYLRPMLAAGLAEGIVSLKNLNPNSLVPAQSGDSFEREIVNASASFDDGKGGAAARASLFLKGKILGSDLLTLAYDSDKPNDTPLFRDIQPDQFYPVYGDSSVKGFDAQSTGKLYVRLDHGTSYGLYGDFSTQSDNPARVLTQYTRALNGAKTHIEDGNLTVDGFVSYTNSTQVIDELPANGTSGPYQLSQRDPVQNSTRIDIITRDRYQPSLVIADTPLTLFTDYAVEPFSGQILFKAPIPSVDGNLNPNYIRVVYEVSNGGPSYWVGGLDAREKIVADVTLGGTVVRDQNPVTRETLGGGNFLWTPNKETSVIGEVAETQSDLNGTGSAHRVELKHTDAKVQAKVYAVQTDASFNNPSSTYTAGAAEYGAKVSAALDAKNRLVIDALKTSTSGTTIASPLSIPLTGVPEAIPGGGSRQGESVALEHTVAKKVKVTGGVRHVDSNGVATQALAVGAVPNEYTSARVRVDAPVPDLPRAAAFAQYEEAIDDGNRKDLTVGSTYQVAPQTKIYGTYQTSNSLSGDYALNPSQQNQLTAIGIDTTYMQDGKVFDEYRVGDGIDGRTAEAALGLRNLWTLAPGLGLSTSVQEIHPISGVVTDTATALTAGLQYTASEIWKGSTKFEWSKSQTAETWLSSIGAAVKISPDLTGLARCIYNEQIGLGASVGSVSLRQEQLGFAYRPVDNDVWNALAWVEHKRSFNSTLGSGLDIDESADIFSTHVNYQVNAAWVINGRYGVKRATDFADGLETTYTAQILGARSVWDISGHWDAGLQYFIETGNIGASREQAVGAEVGYLVMKNVWLSLGYNVLGFTDEDLASEDYTQRAFYLRIRIKFDENLFKPSHNAEPLPASSGALP